MKRRELRRRWSGATPVGEGVDATERMIGMLDPHYAQPLNRIVRFTLDDLPVDADGAMLLHLGDPPAQVPPQFAAIMGNFLTARGT